MATISVQMELQGIEEIRGALRRLTGSQQRSFIRKGASAAAQIQINAARQRLKQNGSDRRRRNDAGKLTGLAKSFMKVPSSKWENAAELRRKGIVGSRIGFRKSTGAHAHLVEFGHRVVTKKGKHKVEKFIRDKRGRIKGVQFVPAYPFMRPAMDANKSQMSGAFEKKIREGIQKLAVKRSKR